MFNRHGNTILILLAELLAGILLLINPVGFTRTIIRGVGLIFLAAAIFKLITCLRDRKGAGENKMDLIESILGCLLGLLFFAGSGWILATFSVLTMLYGILMLIGGISKVRQAWNLRRWKRHWGLAMAAAGITVIAALVIIANPFSTTVLLWNFIGISMIVEAVLDVLGICSAERRMR